MVLHDPKALEGKYYWQVTLHAQEQVINHISVAKNVLIL